MIRPLKTPERSMRSTEMRSMRFWLTNVSRIISNRNYYTLVTDLYAAYVTFCKGRGTRPKEMNSFGRKLADHGIYAIRRQDDKSRERYHEGVNLLKDMRDIDQQTL